MVAIPNLSLDPTLEMMNKAVEAHSAKEVRRTYLGASQLGSQCERKVYYQLTNAPREPRKASLIYAAEDGYRAEEVIADRLRLVPGVELWTHDDNGKQFEFSDLGGELKGHPDGIILGILQAPKTPHIWENKSKKQKLFDEFIRLKEKLDEKSLLREWNFEYFVQAQLLMHYFEMTRHYMTVCLAGAREIASCRTDYDKQFALAQIEKGKRLLQAVKNQSPPPRISQFKSFHVCQYLCEFKEHCWKE